jgi:hypothetical protein
MPPLDIHVPYRAHKLYHGHEWKLLIIKNFRSPMGITLSKNVRPYTYCKTELDLDILMKNFYTKFHFNMFNQCKENERKLQLIGILRSPSGITLSNFFGSYPKQNVSYIFLVTNLYAKFHFSMWNQCDENKQKLLVVDRPTDRQQQSNMLSSLRREGRINIGFIYWQNNLMAVSSLVLYLHVVIHTF